MPRNRHSSSGPYVRHRPALAELTSITTTVQAAARRPDREVADQRLARHRLADHPRQVGVGPAKKAVPGLCLQPCLLEIIGKLGLRDDPRLNGEAA